MPPDTIWNPWPASAAARARAFATTCWLYARNDGSSASRKQTALAAMMCSSGPPCAPGNTALSIALACAALHRIRPPRGPRSVLWVVVVTTSACGTGDG